VVGHPRGVPSSWFASWKAGSPSSYDSRGGGHYLDTTRETIYVVCSWINDWDAGRWAPVAPEQSRFATRDQAFEAFGRHQQLLDELADGSAVAIEEGVHEGYLIAESGISVVNAVFEVPASLVRLIDSTRDHKEWPDDRWELSTALMMSFLVEDGSYTINYELGRGSASLSDELDWVDLEELLRKSQSG